MQNMECASTKVAECLGWQRTRQEAEKSRGETAPVSTSIGLDTQVIYMLCNVLNRLS